MRSLIQSCRTAVQESAKAIALSPLIAVGTPARLKAVGELIFRMAGRRSGGTAGRPRKLAVVKLDRLGDVALSSPFLAALRRAWPEARITLIVRTPLLQWARLCPDVDEVIGLPVAEGRMLFDPSTGRYLRWKQQLARWAWLCHSRGLWKRRFDAAVLVRWELDYYGATALTYLLGARQCWGVGEKVSAAKAAENRGFDRLLSNVVPGHCSGHEVALNATILRSMGIDSLAPARLVSWTEPASRDAAAHILRAAGVTLSRPFAVICMGAGYDERRKWPPERYAHLLKTVFDCGQIDLVSFGTADEARLGGVLKEALGDKIVTLEGAFSLAQMAAAVSLGALYIGSDTGTMHLAVAAGLPILELSCHPIDGDPDWPQSPARFGPWAVPNRVLRPPTATPPCESHCDAKAAHCILGVSVEAAAAELRSLLEEVGLSQVCLDPTRGKVPLT